MTGNVTMADTNKVREYCATLDSDVAYYQGLVSDLENAKTKIQANWEGDAVAISDVIARIDQTIKTYKEGLIPAVSGLSTSMVEMADAVDQVSNNTVEESTDVTTDTTVAGSSNGPGNIVGGALSGAAIGAGIGSIIPGVGTAIGAGVGALVGGLGGGVGAAVDNNTFEDAFWSKHGNNFKEAWTSRDWTDQWDYSECEGIIDGIGQTVDGLLGTVSDLTGSIRDTVGAGINFVFDGAGEALGGLAKGVGKFFGSLFG